MEQTRQLRKYEVIWITVRDNCDPDLWTTVTVENREMIQTVINMVQLEKSRAHLARKALDLPGYGRLEIARYPKELKVSFRLKNAGAQL